MTNSGIEYPKNLIEKAKESLSDAEEGLKGYPVSYSNIIGHCQSAIELSGKAVFKIMGLDFPKNHQLLFDRKKEPKEVRVVTKQLLQKEFPKDFVYRKDIPRLVFLTYFWHGFYTLAKYGLAELNIPPDKLFKEEDAKLALEHAKLCVSVANNLLFYFLYHKTIRAKT